MKQLTIEPTLGGNVHLVRSTLGNYVEIGDNALLSEVAMGDYSYCAGYNQIEFATIGKFVSIATFVRINPGNHPSYMRVAQHHFTYRSAQYALGEDDEAFFQWRRDQHITIGNDVWIGHNAVIMAGVSVGDGAVIGSGAVVTHDVGAYEVVAGVPAKVIKRRFDEQTARAIQQTRWWDWEHDTLKERLNQFKDIDAFLTAFAEGNK